MRSPTTSAPPAAGTITIDSPWLLVEQAATYAQTSKYQLLQALRDGSLRGAQTKKGGIWRTRREWLDSWLQGQVG